jgi:protein-L-isoaspartate(D-aspartate) O-methyltransferase
VVTDLAGRILLGWSARRAVWELPGGKNDADEDFVDAAVRELQEETGLKADPADARLLALLMDSVHGIPRMTAAVRVTGHTGEPSVTEPELVRRWEWHEITDLPTLAQPLFTPSAHVINTVWPGLLPGLPPVHRYPVASAPMRG